MAALGRSFQKIGADYDRYRPGFPPEVLDLLAPHTVHNALDLGAGTGKFTELLVRRAHHVVAVEPSKEMLAVLVGKLPEVSTHLAPAEAIPVATTSQDLVTVAQAFHWFDQESACAEISRILRPGGILGLLWNTPDPECRWDRKAYNVAHPGLSATTEDGHQRQQALPNLESLSAEAVRWKEQISRHDYIRRWLTVSTFLAAKPSVRADMVLRIERILDEDPDTAGREELDLTHFTEVLIYRKPVGLPPA